MSRDDGRAEASDSFCGHKTTEAAGTIAIMGGEDSVNAIAAAADAVTVLGGAGKHAHRTAWRPRRNSLGR